MSVIAKPRHGKPWLGMRSNRHGEGGGWMGSSCTKATCNQTGGNRNWLMRFAQLNCWYSIGSGQHSKANFINSVLEVLKIWPNEKEIVLSRIFNSTCFRTRSLHPLYLFNTHFRLGDLKSSLLSCWRLKSSEMLRYVIGKVGWLHMFRNNIPQFRIFSITGVRTSNLAFLASKGKIFLNESGISKDSKSRKTTISAPQHHSCNAGTRTASLVP